MDGTLFDTMGELNRLAQKVMHQFYGTPLEEAARLYKQTSGLPFRYQLETLFPNHESNQLASDLFEVTKVQMYQKPVSPFPEVFEHVKLWRDWGLKTAISSNDEIANVKIKIGPHIGLFNELVGHKPLFLKGKPHFEFLSETFQISFENMLFVGDSLHDAQLAYECGIRFIGRVGTFSHEEFLNLNLPLKLVNDFYELHGILQHF